MAFFDELSESLSTFSREGINKAKEVKDTAKVTMDIREREAALQKYYRELGKAYYRDHADELDGPYLQVEKITATLEKIDELKRKRANIRKSDICPSCSCKVAKDARFCPNCGMDLNTIPDEPEEDAKDAFREVADAAEEAAEGAADAVKDAVDGAADAAKDIADKANDAAADAVEDAADAAKEAADDIEVFTGDVVDSDTV